MIFSQQILFSLARLSRLLVLECNAVEEIGALQRVYGRSLRWFVPSRSTLFTFHDSPR